MKHILLCVAGMTPQIITETLYALTQERKEQVDQIQVITTLGGRNRLLKELLDPDSGKFFEFCDDYEIDPAGIKFDETTIALLHTPDGRTMADIRTPEENEYAGDQICEIVRGLASDANVRIHASAAGGRKTMSIYLTAAMQLFGRAQDALSHVLVNEEFETHPDFYYIPPAPRLLKMRDGREVSTETAKIHLAPIPFIRLQGVAPDRLRQSERSYNLLVRQTQADLDLLESTHDLTIDLRNRKIEVSNCSVRLAEREFFIYTLFAHLRRQRGEKGFVDFDEIRVPDLDAVFRLITRARGTERPAKDADLVAGFDFLPTLIEAIDTAADSDPKSLNDPLLQVIARIKRKFAKAGRLDRYLIVNRGGYAASRYGLDIPPERIILR